MKHAKCAVFGVGNSDWASTFHRIPKVVHRLLTESGATTLVDPGFVNVKEDPVGPWDEWVDKLFAALTNGDEKVSTTRPALDVTIEKHVSSDSKDLKPSSHGTVLLNKELAGAEVGPAKRHVEIRLPENVSYTTGDYLVVQPRNHPEDVYKVLAAFKLEAEDTFMVKGSTKAHLPAATTSVGDFFSTAVELGTPITKRQLENIIRHAPEGRRQEVAGLVNHHTEMLAQRYSIVDVLQHYQLDLPFAEYIDMLPVLAPRQYSISSSSLVSPKTVSLTIDVHESAALSGNGVFHGVASTYLASRLVGDRINCYIRPTQVGFRIPTPETPLIMIAAGTGIAPMHAFLEERAAIAEAGVQKLGPATLYFGCRDEDKDFIYKQKLVQWEQQGIVKVKAAFSKMSDRPRQYVPELIWEDKDEIGDMFKNGGKIFLCGSAARLGQSTAEVCKKIYSARTGSTPEEAEIWLQGVKTDRYVSDVY